MPPSRFCTTIMLSVSYSLLVVEPTVAQLFFFTSNLLRIMQSHRPTGISNAVLVLAATTLTMAVSLALIAAALFLLMHLEQPQIVRLHNF